MESPPSHAAGPRALDGGFRPRVVLSFPPAPGRAFTAGADWRELRGGTMDRMQAILREQDILDVLAEGEALVFKHSPT